MWGRLSAIIALMLISTFLLPARGDEGIEVRIKDIAKIQGMASNQLLGYGLVVGLPGTGDSSRSGITRQSLANMLMRIGIRIDQRELYSTRNTAAVMVTAELPPFAKEDDRIDVTVASIGDAISLSGGILLLTTLRGPNGVVYATAQGRVSVSDNRERMIGRGTTPVIGIIQNGGLVARDVEMKLDVQKLSIRLNVPDFNTASLVAKAINSKYPDIAKALDNATISLTVPEDKSADLVGFVAEIKDMKVVPDSVARVVVNERTGAIVISQNVRVSPVAVSCGELKVEIKKISGGASLDEVIDALNAIGATPRQILSLLQAMKAAGALHAELIVM
jgi:flagellar P-ring protein precursor FlgI